MKTTRPPTHTKKAIYVSFSDYATGYRQKAEKGQNEDARRQKEARGKTAAASVKVLHKKSYKSVLRDIFHFP